MTRVIWTIDAYGGSRNDMVKVPIDVDEFRIGRTDAADFTIAKSDVSRSHAIISRRGDGLFLRDLGSTNGTHLNHERISTEVELRHGDVLHFGSQEFRVMSSVSEGELSNADNTVVKVAPALSKTLPVGLASLQLAVERKQVRAVFQSIVTPDGALFATEALGRGSSEDLPEAPWPLFQLAESGDLEIPLSELFREVASLEAIRQAPDTLLFLNSHPSELRDIDRLMASLAALPHVQRGAATVLEVHEDGISDLGMLRALQSGLREMNIGLAYDDFGAGQSRLRELVEVPPDFLKFDMGLIRDIDSAPQIKRNLVASLAETANEAGTTTLAEGVSTADELRCCVDMGMKLIQGFYFCRPEPDIPLSGHNP